MHLRLAESPQDKLSSSNISSGKRTVFDLKQQLPNTSNFEELPPSVADSDQPLPLAPPISPGVLAPRTLAAQSHTAATRAAPHMAFFFSVSVVKRNANELKDMGLKVPG